MASVATKMAARNQRHSQHMTQSHQASQCQAKQPQHHCTSMASCRTHSGAVQTSWSMVLLQANNQHAQVLDSSIGSIQCPAMCLMVDVGGGGGKCRLPPNYVSIHSPPCLSKQHCSSLSLNLILQSPTQLASGINRSTLHNTRVTELPHLFLS